MEKKGFDLFRPGMQSMFANYGLAMMRATMLEKELMLLLVAAHRVGESPVPSTQVHAIIKEYDDETFGEVFRFLKKKVDLPDELRLEIRKAVLLRNDLAHKFFIRNIEILLLGDPNQMNEELKLAGDVFLALAPKVDGLLEKLLSQFDIPFDQVDEEVKRLIKGAS
jgi:hypothetical protein